MMDIVLSEKQQEIVNYRDGALLVKASAGSGKTRVLTERVKKLAEGTRRKILAITFTNKACEEIKNRIKEQNPELLKKVDVFTFHGFCNSVLEKHGTYIGYAKLPEIISSQEEIYALMEEAVKATPTINSNYQQLDIKKKKKIIYDAIELVSRIKRNFIPDEELYGSNQEGVILYFTYRSLMQSMNAIDFDDMLLLVYKLFTTNVRIADLYRRNYVFICIDEAQDLNNAQYRVLRSLANDGYQNVMMVGDPKQSIYAFNGSSKEYMLKHFVADYNPVVYELTENYRSAREILAYANKLIPGANDMMSAQIQGMYKELPAKTEEEEINTIITLIQKLLKQKKLKYIEYEISEDDITVLARNKYILEPLEKKLEELSIPYYYKNTSKVYKPLSTHGQYFETLLSLRINPQDVMHESQAKSIEKLGVNQELCDAIKMGVDSIRDDGSNFKTVLQRIKDEIMRIASSIAEDDELIMAYKDFNFIESEWVAYAKTNANHSILSFRNAMTLGTTNVDVEHHGISLSTVHTMKGQENSIVILMGMDDSTFPDYRAVQQGGNALDQERNNLYVAITRAKRYLFITYPLQRTMPWGGVYSRSRSRLLP